MRLSSQSRERTFRSHSHLKTSKPSFRQNCRADAAGFDDAQTEVRSLPGGGVWAPADHGGMYWSVVADGTKVLLVPGNPAGLPDDVARQQMINAAAFAGFSPGYVLRLIAEIENFQQQLQRHQNNLPPTTGSQTSVTNP